MRQVREAKVPEDRASELIPRLFDDGIADPSARITRAEGFRLVPIKEERCGDAIALGLLLLQRYTGVVKLDPTTYYVETAPVEINVPIIIALNVVTLVVSVFVLIAPSYFVSHIHPAKSMRYE